MLDQDTKRKIDSARDILVGKVPDPKQQVDQITNALIYKFMDDMDKEAQELGGKAKFFTGDLQGFAWHKLLDKRLSGQERMDLYVRAISSFSISKQLPQLFRDIFKDAFLPYRDPETLSLFLKEIDGFTYDHSEDLGDAFEYLLSVLGSQGEAGQFRTPRHIIDFIVEVVDPKKDQTILDPACGTAGFLISTYKHIMRDHDGLDNKTGKQTKKEKRLTPTERKKLVDNFVGYDISPDMVKLSLVNMYLHGFKEPKIYEYDTLTSEKYWGKQFDVIIANPPFMTPKGGIRPHKRFSVQAKRSEVLFVDYILEHLNLKGRAGIIVPEGIIFKAENAYKQLRQMLVEDGLFAVASLPAGVFKPYAGVKTSILFFDNQLAQKTDEILFLKIENDGFELGDQRRKIEGSELPIALHYLQMWKETLRHGGKKVKLKGRKKWDHGIWVKKEKIAKSGDYDLTGERYRENAIYKHGKWPLVELGDEEYFSVESGGTPDSKNKDYWDGNIAWITLVDLPASNRITKVKQTQRTITEFGLKKSSAKLLPVNSILVSSRATIGRIGIAKIPLATNQGFKNIVIKDFSKVDPVYLANALTSKVEEMQRMGTGGTYKEISKSNFSKIKISLPPLEVQKQIVEQIEVKQNAIEHAKAVIENLEKERRYFGQKLRKLEGIEWVELGKIMTLEYGKPLKEEDRKGGKYPVFGSNGVVGHHNEYLVKGPFIIVGRKGTAGAVTYSEKNGFPIDTTFYVQLKDKYEVALKFLYLVMQTLELGKISKQAGVPGLNRNDAYKVKMLLPSLEIQKELVVEAEKEEEIITANRRLIKLMEKKIGEVLKFI